MKFQIGLRAVFIAVAAIGALLATHRTFWNPSLPNHQLLLGEYVILAALATVLGFLGNFPMKRAFQATAIFSWVFFVCALKAGFQITTMSEAHDLAVSTKLGLALMGVCILASVAVFTIAAERPKVQS